MNDAKKRFEDQLAQWFKINEAKGYSEDNLKLYLIEHGYHALDVKEAIESFRGSPQPKQQAFDFRNFDIKNIDFNKIIEFFKNFNYKKFFQPSFLKLFLPGVLLLLVLLSFIVNSLVYPKIGALACQETELQTQQKTDLASLTTYSRQIDADPGSFIGIINKTKQDQQTQDELYAKNTRTFRTVALTDFYLYNTGIYHLNFLFPVPCNTDTEHSALLCYDYYPEETTSCLTNFALDADSTKKGAPVGFIVYFINALLLIAVLYAFACLFVHLLDIFVEMTDQYKLYFIGGIVLLLIIGLLTGWSFLVTMMIIMLLFAAMAYVRGIEFRELLLAIFAFIMLIFMFILFFAANAQDKPSYQGFSALSLSCNTTTILSPDDVLSLLHSQSPLDRTLSDYYTTDITQDPYYPYSHEVFNVCTDCKTQCTDACRVQGLASVNPYSLRGSNPSCVCTCVNG